jgi:hypothetical protein
MADSGQPLREDVRQVSWWVLVGLAAGVIAGTLVGGVGGRLAMLLLRLTSDDKVLGVSSDDGFEIGVMTGETFNLILSMAAAGGINGVFYALLRSVLPQRARLLIWAAVAAVFVGSVVVHVDGVDFRLLEPTWLAIVLFVALPGLAAALVVVLTERWIEVAPFSDSRLTVLLVVFGLAGTLACVFAAGVGALAVLVRRLSLGGIVARIGRIAVPVVLLLVIAGTGADLARDISDLL